MVPWGDMPMAPRSFLGHGTLALRSCLAPVCSPMYNKMRIGPVKKQPMQRIIWLLGLIFCLPLAHADLVCFRDGSTGPMNKVTTTAEDE